MRRIALAVALFSLSLAAFAQDAMPTPVPSHDDGVTESSAAPTPAVHAVVAQPTVGAPAEGMAQIVFFRPRKFAGSAVNFKVREGDRELGKLSSGKYFVVDVAPGSHSYVVHSEAKDVLDLELEAGETYYVKGSIGMGVLVARPNISPSSEDEFKTALGKMKRVASDADMAAQAALEAGAASPSAGEGDAEADGGAAH